jgi:DNA mismatch repair protein MutS
LEARERTRTGIASLKVEYNRVHGFYIEVTERAGRQGPGRLSQAADAQERRALHHARAQGFEDRALSAQERALARERVLYDELLDGSLRDPGPAVGGGALALLDVLANLAERADALDSCARIRDEPASRSTAGAIRSSRSRSTLRAERRRAQRDARLLIVTGPNMGGKSTYMRQTAIVALLAHCGIFVPRERARLGRSTRSSRASAPRTTRGGRSTFMVEMTEAAYILNRATPTAWC